MAKSISLFTWTDDEVELFLKVTNEYKVSKTAEGVDWESVQRRYSDILDCFREQIDNSRGLEKDFPHKGEEISNVLQNNLKSIRLKYRKAVDTGKRSGHGHVVLLYCEHCEVRPRPRKTTTFSTP